MAFFNKKEEVIDIELTPYGKHLLSKGKWKPAYYEFYDDDVVYDFEYGGTTEKQDEIQPRIKETPRQKVQYSFEGAETRYKEYIKQQRESDGNNGIATLEKRKNFSLTSLPLANSAIEEQKLPAWNINVLRGKIAGVSSSADITGLPNNVGLIQLDNVYFLTSVKRDSLLQENPQILEDREQVGGVSDINYFHKRFPDGTYISIQEDYLLLDINESNVEILNENFEVMLYMLEIDEKTGQEIEVPLNFQKQQQKVINNVYVEQQEEIDEIDIATHPELAEHYFNVYIDREISPSVLCKHLSKEEIEKLKAKDGYTIECEDVEDDRLFKPIQTRNVVTQQDLDNFEDC